MRLLNVRTLQISTFYNQQTRPAYAIFSHMWGEEEVTFDDIKNLGRARALKGFRKIEFCCRTAEERGLDWVWIDTCSIDKSSSAELSEAINSMFEWYGCAKECYAYLEDLPGLQNTDECGVSESQNFAQSRWFTRGWTLQELISPRELRFYDRNWNFFATRFDMAATLSKITSIDESIFHVKHDFRAQFSIAQRMSWASRRETTREEDMAYCLMGLFDVNMPLLYGEGVSKSFLRLQEEILKRSEDHSIFLWNPHSHLTSSGLLACSARDFTSSGCYVSTGTYRHKHEMTNLGLRITLPTILNLVLNETTALELVLFYRKMQTKESSTVF
ncbi:HET-domain-containing protein [Tothia fuscella]|uniref:HET-domain-containing protein n=1 Tax=Tothia fuscella TaxID=1048955 RepID=A0A9P4P1Q3_9PEZI|nr:HET-domain-containing protein [Tothia fuscella]